MKEGLRRLAIVLKIFAWTWLVLWAVGGGIGAMTQRTDHLLVFGFSVLAGALGFALFWPLGWIVEGFSRTK